MRSFILAGWSPGNWRAPTRLFSTWVILSSLFLGVCAQLTRRIVLSVSAKVIFFISANYFVNCIWTIMIRFLLNNKLVQTDEPPGMLLLDLIRYGEFLTGTKIGCREGDCGACTVLVGELKNGKLHYQSMTSCLLPIGNAHGKHTVTVEGINMD